MKNEEDEAFDELARKQGMWGGGFQAKRKMAADKLQEPDEALTLEALKYAASKGYGHIVRENSAPFTIKAALPQPEQAPVARVTGVYGGRFTYDPINRAAILPVGMALYSAPQHTTTWVGLTDEDCKDMSAGDKVVAMWANRILKEKNT